MWFGEGLSIHHPPEKQGQKLGGLDISAGSSGNIINRQPGVHKEDGFATHWSINESPARCTFPLRQGGFVSFPPSLLLFPHLSPGLPPLLADGALD